MTEEENVQHCFYVFILHKRTQICLDFLRADRAVLIFIGPATCTDTSTSAKSSLAIPQNSISQLFKASFSDIHDNQSQKNEPRTFELKLWPKKGS